MNIFCFHVRLSILNIGILNEEKRKVLFKLPATSWYTYVYNLHIVWFVILGAKVL